MQPGLLVKFLATVLFPLVSGATCNQTYTWYLDWSVNSKGQDPCEVATILWAACPNGSTLAPLTDLGRTNYSGPAGPQDNTCFCSYPMYNLIAACGDCQVGHESPNSWPSYDTWTLSCSQTNKINYFPINIPDNTAIPPWARLTITDSGDPGFSYGLSYALAKDRVRLNNAQTSNIPSSGPNPTSVPCTACTDAVAVGAGAGTGGLVIGALLASVVALLCLRRGHNAQRLGIPKPGRYEMGHPGWTTIPQSDASQSSSLLMPWLRSNPGIHVEPFEPPLSPSHEQSVGPRSPSYASGGSLAGGHSQRTTTVGSQFASEHEVHKPPIPPHLSPNQPARPTASTSSHSNTSVPADVRPPTSEFEVEELPPAYQRRPRRKA